MNNSLTKEELTNVLALINRAHITGQEATGVAILQQKLAGLINSGVEKSGVENSGVGNSGVEKTTTPQNDGSAGK